MLTTLLIVTFWACTAAVVHTYLGYAVVIYLLSRWFGGPASASGRVQAQAQAEAPVQPKLGDDPAETPFVSLLVAAHNEQDVIAERIRNALATDYPADRFEVVIGSDGSDDATNDIVRSFVDRGVRLFDYRERGGKTSVLNRTVPQLRGDIVLLSDANTHMEPGAVRSLVRWFRDPGVGVVCGKLVLTDPATGRNADGAYWKYETFLKRCESRLGALLGSNGAIYAIRKSHYVPIPQGTIVDDFIIPLLAKLRSGCRIIYDCDAVAHEETAADVSHEFRRRCRIGAGGFQSIAMLWRLLDPRRGWVAFSFFSHKVLRWLCPFFMLGALASNAALVGFTQAEPRGLYRFTLAAQGLFYALAAVAPALAVRVPALRPLRLVNMFASMNAALLVGFFRWLRGGLRGTWERTQRQPGVDGGEAARDPHRRPFPL